MWRCSLLRASLLIALSAAVYVAIPATEALAVSCVGSGTNLFDGYFQVGHPEHPYEGASAYMVVRDGQNCSGRSNAFVSDWIMIAAGPSPHNGWGQVGFTKDVDMSNQLRWFSQFWDGTGSDYIERDSTFIITNQIGVRHTFRVLWTYSCYCLVATIDTTTWDKSGFNPYSSQESNWGPQPWSPQFNAESFYLESNVPGFLEDPVAISALGAQRAGDDQLESMPCILRVRSDSSHWHHQAISCTAVYLWTG